MAPDEEAIREAIEAINEGMMYDFTTAIKEIHELVNRVYDGEASAQERKDYKEAVEDLFTSWTGLVVRLFAKYHEHPVSSEAIEFYTLMDTTRALLGLEPNSEKIIQKLREDGHLKDDD